jgi:hypothetical protein
LGHACVLPEKVVNRPIVMHKTIKNNNKTQWVKKKTWLLLFLIVKTARETFLMESARCNKYPS